MRAGDEGVQHFTRAIELQTHLRCVQVTPRISRAAALALHAALKAARPAKAAGKKKKKKGKS